MGARAFYVFEEVDGGIAGAADGVLPYSPHYLFELSPVPGTVTAVGNCHDLFYRVSEAVYFGGTSLADGFQDGNDLVRRDFSKAGFFISFSVRFAPPVSGCFLVGIADQFKIAVRYCLSLSRRNRCAVVFHMVFRNCEGAAAL